MDKIEKQMSEIKWSWASKDPRALAELESRIKRAGRRKTPVNYSDLAQGVLFHVPSLNGGEPFMIDTRNWSDLHRALIGEFLGYISMRSYKQNKFMASALVVSKTEAMPSEHFFEWMVKLGAVPDKALETVIPFWTEQLGKAYLHFSSGGL